MKLLDFYKQLCKDNTFYGKYFSTSSANYGKIFCFINTNYRGILIQSGDKLQGFANGFRVIENVEGIKRSNWSRRAGTQQEVQKQHVVNMRKSEFFRVVDDAYEKTSRGIVFKKLIDNTELNHYEKNFICYILILAGYFADTPNYIVDRTQYVYDRWGKAGFSTAEATIIQKTFIKKAIASDKTVELFDTDYMYLDSFYQDFDGIDFLNVYYEATEEEKAELKKFVSDNYIAKNYVDTNNGCLISYKYKPGGNYVKNTILDNAWILFVTKKMIDAADKDFDSFIKTLISAYKELFAVDEAKLRGFIYDTDKNRSVMQVIFGKVAGVSVSPLTVEKDLTEQEIKDLGGSDSTDIAGSTALDTVSQSLKKLAKIMANYKCTMEECEICKYFTAKENNKHYLEIHHFIPREFANDFDVPIEVVENYVALCPNCHRKIHFAVDSERKYMINTLYNKRKDALASKNLIVTLKDLYSYYKIDE